MKRSLWGILLAAVLLLAGLPLAGASASGTTTTVMMYMCGTDLESDCVRDMKEMTQARYGDDVTVLVLAGGAKKWDNSALTAKRLNLFTIADGQMSAVTDWGSASMGSPDTLKKFIRYGLDRYPADRTMLVLWDHGGGPASGVCFDEVHNDDGLTLTELSDMFAALAKERADFHLDIVGCDACLMANYEMAAMLAPYADYFIASEELEPWLGWYYTDWLTALGSDPGMSDRALAEAVVTAYRTACEKNDPDDYLTLSVIDLEKIPALTESVENISAVLKEQLTSSYPAISRTLSSMYVFGNFDNAGSDTVDLKGFLTFSAAYAPEESQKALELLDSAVVKSYATANLPTANGLSVFVPLTSRSTLNSTLKDYTVPGMTGYISFLKAYAAGTGSGSGFTTSDLGQTTGFTESDYTDSGFVSSAYGYSYGNSWTDWDWDDSQWFAGEDTGSWSWGYGYGSGYGYNTSGIVIAGTSGLTVSGIQTNNIVIAGQPSGTASATPAPEGGIVIAGGQATPAPSATAAPAAQQTSVSIVIAGTQAAAQAEASGEAVVTVPEQIADADGYYMELSGDELDCLSYAEMMLFMDLSDEEDTILLDLGCVRDTWVDWNVGRVYSLFSGSVAMIGDIPVALYDQAVTERVRRSIVPVQVNGADTYLVVRFDKGSTEGRILGTSAGWTDNGLPVRGITPLNEGDVILPRFTCYTAPASEEKEDPESMETLEIVMDDDNDFVIVWDGTQTVTFEDVRDPADPLEVAMAFRLHDVFGGTATGSLIRLSV